MIVETRPDALSYTEDTLKNKIDFTDAFPSQKVRKLPKRFYYVGGRAISKILVVIIIAFAITSSVTVYAVVKILELKRNDINTDIRMHSSDMQQEITIRYFPTDLPDNYKESERELTKTASFVHYTNGNFYITFRQQLSKSEGSVDTEETIEKNVTVNGIQGMYSEKHGEKSLVFSNVAGTYLFYLDTNSPDVTQEKLLKIAESLKEERTN